MRSYHSDQGLSMVIEEIERVKDEHHIYRLPSYGKLYEFGEIRLAEFIKHNGGFEKFREILGEGDITDLNEGLDGMIKKLALTIKLYPVTSKDEVMDLVQKIEDTSLHGQKQICKDKLVKYLVYNLRRIRFDRALSNIPINIMYLKDLKVQNIEAVFNKAPRLVNRNIQQLKSRVEYLERMGFKGDDLAAIITVNPRILTFGPKVIKNVVRYFHSIGIYGERLSKLAVKFPDVLTLNVERNLKPKYEYLTEQFGAEQDYIVDNPIVLSFSLKNRIKPRCDFLRYKKRLILYSLATILTYTADRFAKICAKTTVSEYFEFKQDYINFNSKGQVKLSDS